MQSGAHPLALSNVWPVGHNEDQLMAELLALLGVKLDVTQLFTQSCEAGLGAAIIMAGENNAMHTT
ncbi:MAG: hypothetical protein ACHP9Y_06045 [Gammaproteobacteria bacterium]